MVDWLKELIAAGKAIHQDIKVRPGEWSESWVTNEQVQRPTSYEVDWPRFAKWRTDVVHFIYVAIPPNHPSRDLIKAFSSLQNGKSELEWGIAQLESIDHGVQSNRLKLAVRHNPSEELHQMQQVASPYDVFLSYSSIDKDRAREVVETLEKHGLTCFLAEDSLRAGDEFSNEIREALIGAREVWFLASKNSNKSDWVQRELGAAWGLKKHIVPLLYQCAIENLPASVSDRHAIDFDKHEVLIERLLLRRRALNASQSVLSPAAAELLVAATQAPTFEKQDGPTIVMHESNPFFIRVGKQDFGVGNARVAATYKAAWKELLNAGLLERTSGKMHALTEEGWRIADQLAKADTSKAS